jgi:hypothetical protein
VSRRPLACLALFAALLSGCAGRDYRPGARPVAAHHPGGEDGYEPAPYPGRYALFRAGQRGPVAERELAPGAAVGFGRGEESGLIALAGAQEIALPEGEYRWHVVGVHHWRRARLAVGGAGEAVGDAVGAARVLAPAACVVAFVAVLAGGLLLVPALLLPAGRGWL